VKGHIRVEVRTDAYFEPLHTKAENRNGAREPVKVWTIHSLFFVEITPRRSFSPYLSEKMKNNRKLRDRFREWEDALPIQG